MEKKLEEMFTGEKINPNFAVWCTSVGLTSCARFGARLDNDNMVQKTFIDACNAERKDTVVIQGDIAAIKMIWKACRRAVDQGRLIDDLPYNPTDIDDTKAMGAQKNQSLTTVWDGHHHFSFTAKHVVSLILMNKLYKHATASPKQFIVISPEEIKLRATLPKSDQADMLKVVKNPDGSQGMGIDNSDVDPCTSHHVFFKRLVALFNSWALVSINDTTWFSYEDVRDFTDVMEDLIFRRVHGHRAPLEFVFKAYLKTMLVFVDQINVRGKTLKECVQNAHQWESIWNSWTPKPEQVRDNSAPQGGTTTSVALDPRVESRMLELHKMTQSLLKNQNKGKGKHKGFGKGKGGKGDWNGQKGKGKGQKGNKGKPWQDKGWQVNNDKWGKKKWNDNYKGKKY